MHSARQDLILKMAHQSASSRLSGKTRLTVKHFPLLPSLNSAEPLGAMNNERPYSLLFFSSVSPERAVYQTPIRNFATLKRYVDHAFRFMKGLNQEIAPATEFLQKSTE